MLPKTIDNLELWSNFETTISSFVGTQLTLICVARAAPGVNTESNKAAPQTTRKVAILPGMGINDIHCELGERKSLS